MAVTLSEKPEIVGNLRLADAEKMVAGALPGVQFEYAGCRYMVRFPPYTEGHGEILPGTYRWKAEKVWLAEDGVSVRVVLEEDWGYGQSSVAYFRLVTP